MKRYLLFLLTAALLCGCHSSKLKLSGRFVGSEASHVYLEHFAPGGEVLVDSVALDASGNYAFLLRKVVADPELYTLRCGNEQVPLLLCGGDRVEVSALGSVVRNYTVSGSDESALLRDFYQSYTTGLRQLDDLAAQYARSTGEEKNQAIAAYTEEFRRIKREQLRFVIEHKNSLAAVYALYQRLPGDPYLFNAESDLVYYRTVAEALAESYPASNYRKGLEREIERMASQQKLLANVRESTYPDLELCDMYGKKIRLSSLAGKVILLDFWSAELGNANVLNAELKQLYAAYATRGFEVYQVAVDRSKPLWIHSVQEQALPWISVSDLLGEASLACRLYQVSKLPTNFLIDRQGNLVGRDLYGKSLEKKLNELL